MGNAKTPSDGDANKGGVMSEQVTTMAAIERDTALRHAVIDAALDCIIMMNQDGLVVEFNPAAERVFGYEREEAVGARLSDLIIPENLRSAHHDGLQRYLSTGEHAVLNKRVEVPAVNKAGDELLVELAISPVEFGGRQFFSAYLRDITEARAAQEQLRSSEIRFQSLFELSPDAIVVINESAVIVDVNSRACELAKMTKETMLGRSAFDFIPEDQVAAAHQGVKLTGDKNTVQVQIAFKDSEGVRIPTEVVGRRTETEAGTLYHGVIRDISSRIAFERQLRDAKEAAEQASASKSDFLANMSHEMRTPLNGVIGSLSLIDPDRIDPEARNLIQAAEHSAETLLILIDDLLDLSRIEAGEVDLEPTVFSPHRKAEMISELFSAMAAKKNIELNTSVDVPEGQFRADAGKIRQVLINLVGNALKFTSRGSVDVSISYLGGEQSGTMQFEVRDTGIGISKKDQAVLFDRFKQADSSKSRSHGGAGLGLAICKELIDIMGGRIRLTSAPGVGSTFAVTLPVERAVDVPTIDASPAETNAKLKGRVLIAEDSETNAMVAKTMLERLGLEYQHVTDGAAAVDTALHSEFDVILMDVSMPILDGLEATRILRERGYKGPIVAMTAHALKEDRDSALAIGVNSYLTKPVRPDALRHELANWLTEADATVEAAGATAIMREEVEALWSGDLDAFSGIAEMFVDELAWRLPKLSEVDGRELEHLAHAIKGAAANVGATRLSALAFELEQHATQGTAAGRDELINRMKTEADAVVRELRDTYIKVPRDDD